MKNNALRTVLTICVCALLLSSTAAQTRKKDRNSRPELWFVARVLSLEPFVIEDIDDYSRHLADYSRSRYQDYEITVETLGKKHLEGKNLKIGDLIKGETCFLYLDQDGCESKYDPVEKAEGSDNPIDSLTGVSPPPMGIRNLRKMPDSAKNLYRNKGLLIKYFLSENDTIRHLAVYRDGTVMIDGPYGRNRIQRRLNPSAVEALLRLYAEYEIAALPSDRKLEYNEPFISFSVPKYQELRTAKPAKNLRSFLAEVDRIADGYVRNATYRITWRWRYQIKDWLYGDILPLDLIAEGQRAGKILLPPGHWERIGQIKVPDSFFAQAAEQAGEMKRFYYRYKNKLYLFEFPFCTGAPRQSWHCYRVAEVNYKKVLFEPSWIVYDDWSADKNLRLADIPEKGLDIPRAAFEADREFYQSFVNGPHSFYREGDYLYQGLTVTFR